LCLQALQQQYLLLLQVDGILVQLPLPKHINEQAVLDAISIVKDVDGFHPQNIGSLAMRGRDPMFVSCTPKGCMELLKRSGVQVAGKTAAVVGRSNIVGLPAALLLQNADATVTMVHSRTPNAEEVVRAADIVIAACGKAEMVKVRGGTGSTCGQTGSTCLYRQAVHVYRQAVQTRWG
jgi:5,10-methylene-tetrahydrofolate dehydrogenase/methenyl tetrahydrofolate cyclohydrolase